MTDTHVINNLWQEMRAAINAAYKTNDKDTYVLRDYVEDVGWHDDLERLLEEETANERQHRKGRPMVAGFGASTAAKLILMGNAANGAKMGNLPSAAMFLVLRKTAVEAEVIGFLCRSKLDAAWIKAVESFDYAKMMAGEVA